MKKTKLALASMAAVAFIAAPAYAASSASASLTDLTVTLYSLGKTAPTITFATGSGYDVYNYAYAYDSASNTWVSNYSLTAGTVSADAVYSHAVATGPSLSAVDTPVNLSSSGSTLGGSGNGSNWNLGQYEAGAQQYYGNSTFTLSAKTFAVFSANGSASATTTVGFDPLSYNEYATASANLSVSGSNGYNGSQNSNDGVGAVASYSQNYDYINNVYTYSGQSSTQTAPVEVSFSNTTNGALTGNFYSSASVYGYSYVAAVPEPETYAMLLAGLGMIGSIVKRRKAKQA